ncbi:hypothetical protein [Peptoniphilus indolicus]|uniref:Uncharacterized protein n=2 Tax=Peptoniphilus indolicus TaxID=33030 RepID=A0A379DAP0_9FIRM|nr:hypothetical protein [Peptoniphilus indolicus]SUB74641.1 Uncharacterised protein [Peptoniphilus indolicus]
MGNMLVYINENNIYVQEGEKVSKLISLEEYNFELEKNRTELNEKYKTVNVDNYLYLWNFILFNNLSNYLIDAYINSESSTILFEEKLKREGKQIIRLIGSIEIQDILGNIITCMINSEDYLQGNIKIDYTNEVPRKSENVLNLDLNYIFNYTPNSLKEVIDKLKVDLVAFKYFGKSQVNENGKFILPIYVDEETLSKKGIDYGEYLINWASLAYLKMLTKIHDFFLDYYKYDGKEGLVNDGIMLALIYLTDYEVKDYPTGLQKSIEVGRSTKGKCYFIDSIVAPMAIEQDLAIVFQAKDVYSVVTKTLRLLQ